MRHWLKSFLEMARGEIKTALLLVLACLVVFLAALISFQSCQIKRSLSRFEARLDTIETQLANAESLLVSVKRDGPVEDLEKERRLIELGTLKEGLVIGGAYCASKNSTVFHLPTCEHAQKISPGNLIWFKTRQEAIGTGRRPCRVCRP